jgi:hypothetical protein
MSDVNTFIDAVGQDINATVVPKVEEFSGTVRDFVTGVIQDVFHRYRPELTGELHTKIVNGAVQVTGQSVRLNLTRRDSGATVASLDIPVALTIRVPDLAVTLQQTTVRLDVVR